MSTDTYWILLGQVLDTQWTLHGHRRTDTLDVTIQLLDSPHGCVWTHVNTKWALDIHHHDTSWMPIHCEHWEGQTSLPLVLLATASMAASAPLQRSHIFRPRHQSCPAFIVATRGTVLLPC
jgi:hypothetical protein